MGGWACNSLDTHNLGVCLCKQSNCSSLTKDDAYFLVLPLVNHSPYFSFWSQTLPVSLDLTILLSATEVGGGQGENKILGQGETPAGTSFFPSVFSQVSLGHHKGHLYMGPLRDVSPPPHLCWQCDLHCQLFLKKT